MVSPDKRRSSHWRCSVKKGVLKNLANFTGKHLCWSLFLTTLQQSRPATLVKLGSNTSFSCKICELFEKTCFEEHLPTDTSINERQETHALLSKKNESGAGVFSLITLASTLKKRPPRYRSCEFCKILFHKISVI